MSKYWRKLNYFVFGPLLLFDGSLGIENNNIFSYSENIGTIDLNRLRLEGNIQHQEFEPFLAKIIVDNQTEYTHNLNNTTNDTRIYRAYLDYTGEQHRLVFGRQRIPFGVGRIWNPIDIFNPIDSFSIESSEREGTEALHYEYAMSDLSNLEMTLSQGKNAIKVKGFLKYADLALVAVLDDENDRDILGYEAEGELFATGLELRSEGGSFHDRTTGERYLEFIVGAEYGLQNSLTILAEYRYDGETTRDYLATSMSYQATSLLTLSLLNITQLRDLSYFVAPAVVYSLGDEMSLSGGALFYEGDITAEFGLLQDSYYLNFYFHFESIHQYRCH